MSLFRKIGNTSYDPECVVAASIKMMPGIGEDPETGARNESTWSVSVIFDGGGTFYERMKSMEEAISAKELVIKEAETARSRIVHR